DVAALHSLPTRRSSDLEDVIRHGAAEEDLVLAGHARVGGEAPQQDEDVGNEEEEVGGLAQRRALAVDVTPDRAAQAVVEALGARSEEHTAELQSPDHIV